jgi:hypothetical protein
MAMQSVERGQRHATRCEFFGSRYARFRSKGGGPAKERRASAVPQ